MSNKATFGIVDSVIFSASLIVSACVGVYFAYSDRKNKGTDSYVFGGKNMSPFPVALSMCVSYVSAITVIGIPSEISSYGIVFMWVSVANVFGVAIGASYFVPLYHRLQLNTVYELGYMAIAVYLPALALNAITPISIIWSIVLTSAICTFYTTLGGMKAVIWTDVLQFAIILAGMLAIFVRACIQVEGFQPIFEAVQEGGRNNFFGRSSFNPFDPRVRSSAFSIMLGVMFSSAGTMASSQTMMQRMLACKSVKKSRIALLVYLIISGLVTLLTTANGLAMYTYYKECDPVLSGDIQRRDQNMPLFVADIFNNVPGMAGLFVAAAYCGTLSTVSTSLNATGAMVVADYISTFFPKMSIERKLVLNKIFTFVSGVVICGLAVLVYFSKYAIIPLFFLVRGAAFGPLLALYLLGTLTSFANVIGAVASLLTGFGFGVWISLGKVIVGGNPSFSKPLEFDTVGCNSTRMSNIVIENVESFTQLEEIEIFPSSAILQDTLYSLSPFVLGAVTCMVSLVVGVIVSIATGCNKGKRIDPALFIHVRCHPKPEPENKKFLCEEMKEITIKDATTFNLDIYGNPQSIL